VRISNRLLGPADTSGRYQAWLASPISSRTAITITTHAITIHAILIYSAGQHLLSPPPLQPPPSQPQPPTPVLQNYTMGDVFSARAMPLIYQSELSPYQSITTSSMAACQQSCLQDNLNDDMNRLCMYATFKNPSECKKYYGSSSPLVQTQLTDVDSISFTRTK
jgi:hypothetical protein